MVSGAGARAPEMKISAPPRLRVRKFLSALPTTPSGQNCFRRSIPLDSSTQMSNTSHDILAHSLGNMLVSAAKQDHGLQYAKYFMLNAAVPVEAYDAAGGVTAESKAGMTHPDWVNYPDRVRASHWWELFPVGDGRRTLTWKGRFANVTDTVNYYSSEEEVLANGNGTVPNVNRDYSWVRQEMTKGRKTMPLMTGRNEAGWEFNAAHMTEPVILYPPAGSGGNPTVIEESRLLTPSETTTLTDAVLTDSPFFAHFHDHGVYMSSNGVIVTTNAAYRAQLLADGIPAESFASGANRVPAWGDEDADATNVNMPRHFKSNMAVAPVQNWIHSFFLKVPYMCVYEFYENIVSRIPKETSNE